MKLILMRGLAIAVTVLALGMSIAGALVRGGPLTYEIPMAGIFAAFCMASHLLLAFFQGRGAVIMWIFCTCATIFGHLSFWTYAIAIAAEERVQHSSTAQELERQMQLLQQTIAGSQSRPVALIAQDLEVEKVWSRRAALRQEMAEARRVENLQSTLIQLAGEERVTVATGNTDLVLSSIAKVTKVDPDTVALLTGISFGPLLELLGAFLWHHVLNTAEVDRQKVRHPDNEVERLDAVRNAVANGQIRLRVREIREWLGCGQREAASIRRLLAQTEPE